MRSAIVVVVVMLAGLADVSRAQIADLCILLDARIQAGDGQFLGRVTPNQVSEDSIVNPNGSYGSPFSTTSIANPNSAYGNQFNQLSARNPNAFDPPRIILNSQTLARLTINTGFAARVDPDTLLGWLRSSAPFQCGSPATPTAVASPTAQSSPTPSEEPTSSATNTPTQVVSLPTPTPTAVLSATPSATPTITNTPTQTRTPTETGTPTNTPTPGPCNGDCNFDGRISIAELITGVGMALGNRPVSDCPSFDITGDGTISIGELVRAVNGALNGCIPLATPTPTRPTSTPTTTPTRTFTLQPTRTLTVSPTATTVPGDCTAVTPGTESFRALGSLAEQEIELTELATTIDVADPRQRHYVRAALSACSDDPPGSVTFRFAIPGVDDRSTVVPIESVCGDIVDAVAATTYEMPVGDYPLSVFVSGSGTYTGGELSVGMPPFEVVETRNIASPLSLLAGESEIPDLRASTTIADACRSVEVSVSLTVAGLEAGIQYQIIVATEGEAPRVSPTFDAGTVSVPATGQLVATYGGLPPGERTFSVFVNQTGGGPALYEEASQLDLAIR